MRALFCMILTLALAPAPALAGDPCPITFDVYDMGTPPWLDRAEVLAGLETKDGWIGIRYGTHADGVVVYEVTPMSPAAAAGLRRDDVITAVGGTPVKDRAHASGAFDALEPGAVLALTVTRGGARHEVALTFGEGDPFVEALFQYAGELDVCTQTERGVSTTLDRDKVLEAVFTENRRFRCDDAHKHLDEPSNAIVVVRGSKRVLAMVPGWSTVCFKATAIDGAKHTKANVLELFHQLTDAFVADRHRNP